MLGGFPILFPAGMELNRRVDFQKCSSASWREGELEQKGDLFLFWDVLPQRWDAVDNPRRGHPDYSCNTSDVPSGIDLS